MIDEKHFDELWEKAEVEKYTESLSAEYPAWRARRRRNMGTAALVLMAAGATLPLLTGTQTGHDSYTVAYCNRANIADQYWVDMADEMLVTLKG